MKKYEITYTDPFLENYGKSIVMTESEAEKTFGKDEWPEYRENYLPHITVCEVDG
jgi:hypothetical protein